MCEYPCARKLTNVRLCTPHTSPANFLGVNKREFVQSIDLKVNDSAFASGTLVSVYLCTLKKHSNFLESSSAESEARLDQ